MRLRLLPVIVVMSALFAVTGLIYPETPKDPLASEIQKWQEYTRDNKSTDENWTQLKGTVEPILNRAERSVQQGKRLYALHLLGAVRVFLAANQYLEKAPADAHQQMGAMEEEWKKTGVILDPVISGKNPVQLGGRSAAVQAVGELAESEIKPYYEASVEYGRNTDADAGLYYIGSALAQYDMARFCASFDGGKETGGLKVSNLTQEMNGFEDELLSQYKPPASVDSHPLFIRTSAMLKEARELESAGKFDGALYEYLNARLRLSKITDAGKSITAEEANRRAAEVRKQLAEKDGDHSLAFLYLEMAEVEASEPNPELKGGETARAVFEIVLPHYFKALEPAAAASAQPKPEVTVTLVRWPYT